MPQSSSPRRGAARQLVRLAARRAAAVWIPATLTNPVAVGALGTLVSTAASSPASAQEPARGAGRVTGLVTDENRQPLAGVDELDEQLDAPGQRHVVLPPGLGRQLEPPRHAQRGGLIRCPLPHSRVHTHAGPGLCGEWVFGPATADRDGGKW